MLVGRSVAVALSVAVGNGVEVSVDVDSAVAVDVSVAVTVAVDVGSAVAVLVGTGLSVALGCGLGSGIVPPGVGVAKNDFKGEKSTGSPSAPRHEANKRSAVPKRRAWRTICWLNR